MTSSLAKWFSLRQRLALFSPQRGLGWLTHRMVALLLLLAWWSLSREVYIIIGSQGLFPVEETMTRLQERGAGFWNLPTHFWLEGSTYYIHVWLYGAMAMAVLAFVGFFPRLNLLGSTLLYLGFCTVCRDMLSFQWDNLMIEMGLLAALTPSRKPAQIAIWMQRFLLFTMVSIRWIRLEPNGDQTSFSSHRENTGFKVAYSRRSIFISRMYLLVHLSIVQNETSGEAKRS